MARFSFVGPSYQSQSVNADAQVCRNWYVETDESGQGKSANMLYPTPGLATFATLPDGPMRGIYTTNGRVFAVSGSTLFEISSGGVPTNLGAVANDGKMASMCASTTQLLVASGQIGYVYNLSTGVFTTAPANLTSPVIVAFSDGFFIALNGNSRRWQISSLFDATAWNPADSTIISVFPDNIVSLLTDHREVWIFGPKQTTVYYDSGNTFPFDVVPGAFIEQGCASTYSPVKMDNTIFWIGADERGAGIAWKASGYIPQRVSNHAIENAWQGYSTIADAISYSYQDQGHSFWVIYFPTANKTWVFDAATQMWHERDRFLNGVSEAHRSNCHAYAFGKHLVGDWKSGTIYQMAVSITNDFGNLIRRVRRAPHVNNEAEWMFHSQLQVDLEAGLGLATGQGSNPLISLRWSDDGGHQWSNSYDVSAGAMGNYKTRAIWRRLGRSRDRVYEVAVSDPVPWRLIDAYLQASPGYQPTERLASQLRKGA